MTDYRTAHDTAGHPYRREALNLAFALTFDASITAGVIRWSNGRVPPSDAVALAAHIGLPVDLTACDAARARDQRDAFAAYRKAQAERSPEQIAEQRADARAAMGPGCDMVNVVTGERFKT